MIPARGLSRTAGGIFFDGGALKETVTFSCKLHRICLPIHNDSIRR